MKHAIFLVIALVLFYVFYVIFTVLLDLLAWILSAVAIIGFVGFLVWYFRSPGWRQDEVQKKFYGACKTAKNKIVG